MKPLISRAIFSLTVVLFFVLALPSTARAACTSPAGSESQTLYDFTNHVLKYCDNTSWLTFVAGAGGGAPGGATTQVQFNNGGSFAGSSGLIWSGTSLRSGGSTASVIIGTDNNAFIEMREDDNAGLPYIDFSNDNATDYDARIQLTGNDSLFIDGANVGIGTASPASIVHEAKNDATVYDATAADGQVGAGPTLFLQNAANANNSVGGQIVFGMRAPPYYARIGATGGSAPALVFGTNLAERMRIDAAGNVGIGTASPGSKLTLSGGNLDINNGYILNLSHIRNPGGDQHLWIEGSDGTARFALRTSDGIGHGWSWASNWKDLAENIQPGAGVTFEAGDVVAIDGRSRNRTAKTQEAYDMDAIGVISTKPGLLMNQDVEDKDARGKPVSLAGRAPTKVSTINGPIAIGDPITPSSIPGVGMKATKRGRIIGYAMEAFPYNEPVGDGKMDAIDGTPYRTEYRVDVNGKRITGTDGYLVGKVAAFINPTFYEPTDDSSAEATGSTSEDLLAAIGDLKYANDNLRAIVEEQGRAIEQLKQAR